MRRNDVKVLDTKEQEGMRKVCRLAREVLDIAAAAVKPGVTTDYLDEIVHKACMERNVCPKAASHHFYKLIFSVISVASKLCSLSQISLHVPQRSHMPWHTGSESPAGW